MRDGVLERILEEAVRRSRVDPSDRIVSFEDVPSILEACKSKGRSVVLTQGTFDLFHIGHARYLRKAKEHGDILLVGVDDDAKARGRKGENRPVVPLSERLEMLASSGIADLLFVKGKTDPRWHLIKAVRPDVLIAVDGTYDKGEIEELETVCGKVVVLPRQATTSTSAKVRTLVLDGAGTLSSRLIERFRKVIPELVDSEYRQMKGGG